MSQDKELCCLLHDTTVPTETIKEPPPFQGDNTHSLTITSLLAVERHKEERACLEEDGKNNMK